MVHDLSVDRTTSQKGSISQYTAAELAAMEAPRNPSSAPTPTGIPALEDLLDRFDDLEHLQLEVKKDTRQRLNILSNRLTEVIQRRNLYQTVAITSSDTWFLKQIRRRNKNIRIGLVAERKFPRPLSIAGQLGCEYLCINWKLCSKALVEKAHRKGMHVSTWTVNRIHDMLQLEEMGVDSIITDGLWDVYNDKHMGSCAETCVRKYQFTREEQDEFAQESYTRAQNTQRDGIFSKEIVPVEIKDRKGNLSEVTEDDEPQRANFEKMTKIRPAFEKDGTVTAANASKINDGAAAVVMMSAEKAADLGVKTVARIVAQASFSQEPEWFTTAPVRAIRKVLDKSGLTVDDINLFEIKEAFAAVTMAAEKDLGLDHDKVNIHGGAVALGHPIGASGARILVTLLNAMEFRKAKLGLATLCIGGGEASAVIVERV